jgi:hypothetical protein
MLRSPNTCIYLAAGTSGEVTDFISFTTKFGTTNGIMVLWVNQDIGNVEARMRV